MANTLITPDVIAPEATRILRNEDIAYALMRNPSDLAEFTGAEKVGDTIKVRTPGAANVREFTGAATSRDITESTIDLEVEKHFYDQVTLTSKERTLDLQSFIDQVVAPVMAGFADELSAYLAAKALLVPYWAGTAGDPPDTILELATLGQTLSGNKAPKRGRVALVDEVAETDLISMPTFHEANKRGDGGLALREASLGRVLGIDWFMDQSVYEHTAGTMAAAAPLVDVGGGVLVDAVSMDIDDVGAGVETILAGDLFTVAGVTGYQGVFTNSTTAVAGQITGATFTPAAPVGGFADDAAITIVGSHTKNVAWSPGAFTAVAFPPMASASAPSRAFFDAATGLGVLVTFDRSAGALSDVISFEMLAGAAIRQKELAAILLG